jgi:hypothetical protein
MSAAFTGSSQAFTWENSPGVAFVTSAERKG